MKQVTGSILFALGMLMATGIEANIVQAIYAIAFMGASCWCFNSAKEKSEKKSINIKKWEDAA